MATNLRCALKQIKPSDIYAYPDTDSIWLRSLLTAEQLRWLRQHCRKAVPFQQPAPFNRTHRVRYDVQVPDAEALRFLLSQPEALLTRADEALDFVFDNEDDLENAYEKFDRYLVKRHHRAEHGVRYEGRTRYTAPRRVKTKIAMYDTKPCRVTGEVYCLHLCFRMKGMDAMSRSGIESLRGVAELDRHAFWRDRLLLRAVDARALGRKLNNAWYRTKRRNWIVSRSYDMHYRTGCTIARLFSTQQIIDQFKSIRTSDCLIPLDIEHLLP